VPVNSVRAGSRIFIKSRCCRTNRRQLDKSAAAVKELIDVIKQKDVM